MKKFSKRINEDNSIQMYKYSMSVDVEGTVLSTSEGDAGEIIDQIVDEIGGVNDTIKVTNYEINTIDVVENDNSYSEIEESNKRVVIKENIEKLYFYNQTVELEGEIDANSKDEAVNKINNINAFEISGALRGVTIVNTKVTQIISVVDESNKRVVIKENNSILNNLDMDVNQHLMSITSNGENMGNVGIKDGKIVTDGFIGYNEYTNFVNLIHGLQGHGIAIDDFYF